METVLDYWLRFSINLLILTSPIAGLYWRGNPNRVYATAMLFVGMLVYAVISLLVHVEVGLGVGFGIFAIFSLLRFRTVAISLRDMTYLFATIAFSIINALLLQYGHREEMFAVNVALILTLAVLESVFPLRVRSEFELTYDNLMLLAPELRAQLFADVYDRTGIRPVKIIIKSANLKRNLAKLQVWYSKGEYK